MTGSLPTYEALVKRLSKLDAEYPNERLGNILVHAASEFRIEGYRCTTDDLIDILYRQALGSHRGDKV